MHIKGQISLEHTALLAVVFTILIIGFFYFASTGEEYRGFAFKSLTNTQGNKLIEAVERAPLLGADSRQSVDLDLPEEFVGARLVSPNTLVFDIDSAEGMEQMVFVSNYPITNNGILENLKPGKNKLIITVISGGVCLSNNGYCGGDCGDAIASETEACDLSDLKGNVCASFPPYNTGVLVCNSDCSGFDFSRCEE